MNLKDLYLSSDEITNPSFLKLNLGCGWRVYPDGGWTNLDLQGWQGLDIIPVDLWDLDWPIDDDSLDYVLASHILEHVPHNLPGHIGEFWNDFISYLFSKMRDGALLEIYGPDPLRRDTLQYPGHTRLVGPTSFKQTMVPPESIASLEKRELRMLYSLELIHLSTRRSIDLKFVNDYHFIKYLGTRWREAISRIVGQRDELRMVFRLKKENGK